MLSFDDGPLPEKTDAVVSALKELRAQDGRPVRAAFFMVGGKPQGFWEHRKYYAPYETWPRKGSLCDHPTVAQNVLAAGHFIGNHTAHHAWFRWPWLSSEQSIHREISAWEEAARSALVHGGHKLLRPPYLVNTKNLRAAARARDYTVVPGISTGDSLPFADAAYVKQKALRILEAWNEPRPCVLVFHDIFPVTYTCIGEIVRFLQDKGFTLVHFDPTRI